MKDDLQHIAKLAKLQLSDEELERFSTQLSTVLEHFEKLNEVDTSGIVPLRAPSPVEQKFRDDEVQNKSGSETSTANALDKSGKLFKVPPVV